MFHWIFLINTMLIATTGAGGILALNLIYIGLNRRNKMKNRFIEYLLQKQCQEEAVAMEQSFKLYDKADPTHFDPFKD